MWVVDVMIQVLPCAGQAGWLGGRLLSALTHTIPNLITFTHNIRLWQHILILLLLFAQKLKQFWSRLAG